MKIKIHNVPKYSHEYLVTDSNVEELSDGTIVRQFRLGINKKLTITTTREGYKTVEFNNSKKHITLPETWIEFID